MSTDKNHAFPIHLQALGVNADDNGFLAYLYGYPLIMMGVTEQLAINSIPTTTSGAAPLNQFGKQTEFATSEFTSVVLPSTSTLYASAFLNLKNEAMILHLPNF